MSNSEFADNLMLSRREVERAHHLSTTLDTLISCLEHDILKKAGPAPKDRRELYNFVVDEFKKLERIEPHRITPVRITLENKRDMALGFADVLAEKFTLLSKQFSLSVESLWAMCKLQRCHHGGINIIFDRCPCYSNSKIALTKLKTRFWKQWTQRKEQAQWLRI